MCLPIARPLLGNVATQAILDNLFEVFAATQSLPQVGLGLAQENAAYLANCICLASGEVAAFYPNMSSICSM